jgi:hypothetical protein
MRFEVSTAAENSDLLGYLHGQQFKISQHSVETLYRHLQGFVCPKRMTYKLFKMKILHSSKMPGHVKLPATQHNIQEDQNPHVDLMNAETKSVVYIFSVQ